MKGSSISVGFTALMVVTMVLTACATSNSKGSDCTPVAVHIPENAWYYQGPGAAASFMLMSSSGPMGAAIGIAIDQGIQKDLLEGVEDPAQIVSSATKEQLSGFEISFLPVEGLKEEAIKQDGWFIEWNQYGFKSDMSSERMTHPIMKATVYHDGIQYGIYSFSDGDLESNIYSLDDMIGDPELTTQVLFQSATKIVGSIKPDILTLDC